MARNRTSRARAANLGRLPMPADRGLCGPLPGCQAMQTSPLGERSQVALDGLGVTLKGEQRGHVWSKRVLVALCGQPGGVPADARGCPKRPAADDRAA